MISILAPTRNRPKEFTRMVGSALATATTPIEIWAYIDEDDQSWPCSNSFFPDNFPKQDNVNCFVGPRLVMSEYWNVLTKYAKGDILMLCGDDVVFETPGWSAMVEQAYEDCPDKILCVHGDDLGPNGKTFATLPFVSRKWVDTVGYFTPYGFSGDFIDTWIQDVADMLGRKRFLPFVVNHMHWIYGKAERDSTYAEKDARQKRDNLEQMYLDRLPERIRDAAKLKAVMNGD